MNRIVFLPHIEISRGKNYHLTMLHTDSTLTYYKPMVPYNKVNIRVEVILSLNSWKLIWQASDHSNIIFFWVSVVKRDAVDVNPLTNLLCYAIRPKKHLISVGDKGLVQLLSASIFVGSTFMPSFEIIWLRNTTDLHTTDLNQNSQLLYFAKSWSSLKTCKTNQILPIFLSSLSEYTRLSSIKTIPKESR